MLKPSWSCLGALLVALLFQTSESVYNPCPDVRQCKDKATPESYTACLKSCDLDHALYGSNELKRSTKQRDIHDDTISSDEGNVDQKIRELMQGDLLDLVSPGVWEEDKEVQGEDQPLIRKARRLDAKRSYSMQHFRWGKPVGKKRRPVKVFPNGVEEESAESYPVDFRRDLSMKIDLADAPELDDNDTGHTPGPSGEGGYRMEHFRWGTPPKIKKKNKNKSKDKDKNKRYGGFMASEKSHTPLMTLFRNAIVKNAHEKGQ
uniref:Pro-opiomelanocortin n=1 Tax=Phascolarctos cinereus TaxID=38626 RepID=A0A6P5K3L7_PHACI|nr:pro-opiomelanocortin [Phascolarctos cinereus]XP_020839612.1 pro-opiomelanocortin [Phascolarctos cinereus]XP_020839613.1 pro-opiomelanocortin [Phascolarctos cinereus]